MTEWKTLDTVKAASRNINYMILNLIMMLNNISYDNDKKTSAKKLEEVFLNYWYMIIIYFYSIPIAINVSIEVEEATFSETLSLVKLLNFLCSIDHVGNLWPIIMAIKEFLLELL